MMDDDTEDDISSTDDPKCSLIPNGPYPLIVKGMLITSTPLHKVGSHISNPNSSYHKK